MVTKKREREKENFEYNFICKLEVENSNLK